MKKEKVLIVGTGALATLFAARLSSAGADVTMFGSWQASLISLKKYGAGLVESKEREVFYPVKAVKNYSNVKFAILLVKSWQTKGVAQQLKKHLTEDAVALTLQNGLGNGEVLRNILGAERVAQGVTTVGASLIKPGVVKMSGDAQVSMGTHPRLEAIESLFRASNFEVTLVADIQSLIWSKLVINAAINPLTALLDIPNGDLLKIPEARKMMAELALETASLAKAQNIPLTFENPVEEVERVAKQTATNTSSMLQDLRRSAPTEIDMISGAITKIGEKFSLPTPTNKICWQLIKSKVNRGKIREIQI
ncbi:MAG: 2-dehydropantoate 2-reductase [Anaerolineae bacterium]|jgi:2-dehydropantoate 2-reductase|nr:2-dehydropantoate 2-reductase [Anaerolineae bacterium]MBT7074639.1 2-dehydropantoate 2-reductase [Anaerolineae bacterium]MBT7781681.1 2-dehydropantoate 2-reductase [Anaerolineae bacterium]